MAGYRGYADEDDDEELRSETLPSWSEDEDGRPKEARAGKRERLRSVLVPAIHSRVSALGGFESVTVKKRSSKGKERAIVDESSSGEDNDDEGDDAGESEYTKKVYKLGDEALGCLKDLKRFWKMDDHDDDRTIARIFYETGVLKNDLVHILNAAALPGASSRQEKAALASADLISAMTWPISPIDELKEAENTGGRGALDALSKVDYQGLIAMQRSYKAAVLKSGVLRSLFQMFAKRLDLSPRERTERDENVISLVLHVFRNLAYIKDRPTSSYHSADSIEESSLQSELICQLGSESIFDMLVTIASCAHQSQYNQWNIITLEIFYLLFRGVSSPDILIRRSEQVNRAIRSDKLSQLLQAETTRKRLETRKGATRHSRFGTTLTIENGKDRVVLHRQAAVATAHVNPGGLMDVGRKGKSKKAKRENDLAPAADYRPDAISMLQAVALTFLESAFNPFFGSLLRDIRMQRPKVRESDHARFLFLVRFFMEYFLALYAYEKTQNLDPASDEAHDFDLVAEMTENASILYVCLKMKEALDEKPPLWTDLHAAVDCFTQLLLIIDGLASSNNEDYKEVAEGLQSKLYYQGETLEVILSVIAKYKDQPLKYLESIVNMAYVMLRMLEKFSKGKEHMYVKKRVGTKTSRRSAGGAEGEDDIEPEPEVGVPVYRESSFDFKNFERKFCTPQSIATYLQYLSLYKEFRDDEQMKRIVKLLHRAAVNSKGEGMFFRATTLELFRRILDDRVLLPRTPSYSDLGKLITYILKTFFKLAKEDPMLLVETFFTNRYTEALHAVHGSPESDADGDDEPKALKRPADLEFKQAIQKSYSWSEQVKLAVSLLVEKKRDDLIDFVKTVLTAAAKHRESLLAEDDAQRKEEIERMEPEEDEDEDAFATRKMKLLTAAPSEEALAALGDFKVEFEDEAAELDFYKNSEVRLLVRLLHWDARTELPSMKMVWSIPPTRTPTQLRSDVRLIDDALLDPLEAADGKTAQQLVTKKYKNRRKPVQNASSSEDDDVQFSDPDVAAAVKGTKASKKSSKSKPRKARKSREVHGEDPDGLDMEMSQGGTKRKKRVAEYKAYHTAEFIVDSDDDEAADRAFFEREAALRKEMEQRGGEGNGVVAKPITAKPTKKAKKQAKKGTSIGEGTQDPAGTDADEDALMSAEVDIDNILPPAAAAALAAIEAANPGVRVPLTAMTKAGRPRPRAKPAARKQPAKQGVSKAAATKGRDTDSDSGEEQDGSPASSSSATLKRQRAASSDVSNRGSDAENSSKVAQVTASRRARIVDSEEED